MSYEFKTYVTIDGLQTDIIVDIMVKAYDRDGGHEWDFEAIMLDNKPDYTDISFESLSKTDQARLEQLASDCADENAQDAYQDYLEAGADQDWDMER